MNFARQIRPHVDAELALAAAAADVPAGFVHLERAHVLGQASTREHVRVHWHMLRWGWRRHDAREVLGQLLRIVGAASKTAFGLVPAGNTGGANVSAFRRMPVPAELEAVLREVRGG